MTERMAKQHKQHCSGAEAPQVDQIRQLNSTSSNLYALYIGSVFTNRTACIPWKLMVSIHSTAIYTHHEANRSSYTRTLPVGRFLLCFVCCSCFLACLPVLVCRFGNFDRQEPNMCTNIHSSYVPQNSVYRGHVAFVLLNHSSDTLSDMSN